MHKHTAFIALLISVLSLSPGFELHSSEPLQEIVIALKPDKDPDKILEEKKALEQFVTSQTNLPTKVITPLSTAVILEGFSNGTIDVGYLSSTGAAKAMEGGDTDILLVGEISGHPHYMSYWVALKDKPYTSVADLKGLPIAYSSKTSTSGFLIPTWDLYKKGLIETKRGPEGFFGRGNVQYGVGYVSAIERVLSGEAEAAAVSYYVLDKDKHLTLQQRAKLKMIAQQGPVPSHTLCVRKSLSKADRALLKKALLALNEKDTELRDTVFSSKLIERDTDEHLKVTREALALVRKLNY